MKIYFLVLTLVSSVFCENWTPKNSTELQEIHTECLSKYDITPAQVRKMDPANTENIQHYFLCTVEKIGIYNTSQGYNVDRFAKQFKYGEDEDQAKTSAKYCISEYYKPDSEGDKGNLEIITCFINKQAGVKNEA